MVKCADCGFLSTWDTVDQEHRESTATYRKTGLRDDRDEGNAERWEGRCLVRFWDLPKLVADERTRLGDGGLTSTARRTTFHEERDCPKFTPWSQGFSPKEHQQMLNNQLLLEWQEKRRRSDLLWHRVELAIVTGAAAAYTIYAASIGRPETPPAPVIPAPVVNVNVVVPTIPPAESPQRPTPSGMEAPVSQ